MAVEVGMTVVSARASRPDGGELYDLDVHLENLGSGRLVLAFRGSAVYADGAMVPLSVEFVEECAAALGYRLVAE